MTAVEKAVQQLHTAGYQASPSPVWPGRIRVFDPVYDQSECVGRLVLTIHPSQASEFIEIRKERMEAIR